MKFSKNVPIYTMHLDTALGGVILAATEQGLAGVWFDEQRHAPDTTGWIAAPEHPVLVQAAAQLSSYFDGASRDFDVPLDLSHGTQFQQAVWQALLRIPRGGTTSYGRLGQDIGKPAAVRAVGAAVGRNPISVVVPCHRVLGSDGSLTGYAGGLDRKMRLLQLEGAAYS